MTDNANEIIQAIEMTLNQLYKDQKVIVDKIKKTDVDFDFEFGQLSVLSNAQLKILTLITEMEITDEENEPQKEEPK